MNRNRTIAILCNALVKTQTAIALLLNDTSDPNRQRRIMVDQFNVNKATLLAVSIALSKEDERT